MLAPLEYCHRFIRNNIATLNIGVVTFALVLTVQIVTKNHLIFGPLLFLDDFFFFERALHNRPFNDLQETTPIFEGLNLDGAGNHNLYRFLAEALSSIDNLKLALVLLFAVCSSLWATIIYRITRNNILSLSISVIAFISPFSFIIGLFTNASYFLYLFLIYGLSLHLAISVRPQNRPRANIALISASTFLSMMAVWLSPSSLLLVVPIYIYAFATNGWSRASGSRWWLPTTLGFLISWGIFQIFRFEHPYHRIENRITHAPVEMLENAAILFARMLQSYYEPPVSTGYTLNTIPWAWFLFGLIIVSILTGMLIAKHKSIFSSSSGGARTYWFIVLQIGACALSLAPLSVINVTHMWHSFPHLVFGVTALSLGIYYTIGARVYYVFAFFLFASVVFHAPRQHAVFAACSNEQESIRAFFSDQGAAISPKVPITLIGIGSCRMSGLSGSFRSVAFRRYLTSEPDAAPLFISGSGVPPTDLPEGTQVYRHDGDVFVRIERVEK